MKIIFPIIISLGFLGSVALTHHGFEQSFMRPENQMESASSDTLIHMQRTACFGFCPVYELKITKNGNVTFIGKQHVKHTGQSESQLSEENLDQMFQKIKESHFWEIPANPECESRMTDMPSVYLTIKMAGKRHHVNHYHGCRGFEYEKELTKLENAIDSLAGVEKWVGEE